MYSFASSISIFDISIGSPNSIFKPFSKTLYFPLIAKGTIFALVFLAITAAPFLNLINSLLACICSIAFIVFYSIDMIIKRSGRVRINRKL